MASCVLALSSPLHCERFEGRDVPYMLCSACSALAGCPLDSHDQELRLVFGVSFPSA